ncbi:hypothetical protein [Terrimonas alba]|uniref:hypothetical protein n=1 Tax=Terrimonas alba TaxID=3349636 RepID=UPI0035F37EE3
MQIFLFFAKSMRYNNSIRRGISLMLLLVFFQQIGAGLFIHNLLHDKKQPVQAQVKKHENAKEISFACSCVDNFLMPFIEADEPVVTPPLVAYSNPANAVTEPVYFTLLIFSSLRGPPMS